MLLHIMQALDRTDILVLLYGFALAVLATVVIERMVELRAAQARLAELKRRVES